MIWHVAFAVDHLEKAMEEFGSALNFGKWTAIKEFEGDNAHADGTPFRLKTRLTFATSGPCALELFEAVPDTPNQPARGTAFHHMGYWTTNVVTERDRLAQCGWGPAGGLIVPDSRAAFFSSTLGIFFEACNVSAQRPGLEKYYPGDAPGMKQPDQFLLGN